MRNPFLMQLLAYSLDHYKKGLPHLPVFITLTGKYGLHPFPAALFCTTVLIDFICQLDGWILSVGLHDILSTLFRLRKNTKRTLLFNETDNVDDNYKIILKRDNFDS